MLKKRSIFIILILILGLLLRIFRFSDTLQLDADQAMAYILADRIINQKHFLMVGPIISVENVNILAPTYYYLIAFLYFIFRNELSISLIFLFINLLGIYLIYLTSKQIVNTKSSLLGALFFSLSSTMVNYSRNIWEPHLIPFFVILSIFLLILAYKSNNTIYLFLSVFTFYISLMYISSLLLLPVFFYLTFIIARKIDRKSALIKTFLIYFFTTILFYINLIIFEYHNGFSSIKVILKTFNIYFVSSPVRWIFLKSVFNNFIRFSESIINSDFNSLLIFFLLVFILPFLGQQKYIKNQTVLKIISFSMIFSLFLSGIYKRKSYPYRYASIYPIFFVLLGFAIYKLTLIRKKGLILKIGWIYPILFLIYFVFSNMYQYKINLTNEHLFNYKQIDKYTDKIIFESNNRQFNTYVIRYKGSPKIEHKNYELTPFAWMLEKKLNKKLFNLNKYGNWLEQGFIFNKPVLMLVCLDFDSEVYKNCYRYLIKKEKLTGINYEMSTLDKMTLFKIAKKSF